MLESILALLVLYIPSDVRVENISQKYCDILHINWQYTEWTMERTISKKEIVKLKAKTIYICDWINKRQKRITLIHEFFHFLWHNHLSEEQRIEWIDLHNSSNFKTVDDFARNYGKVNEGEDFATMWEFIFLQKKKSSQTEHFWKKINFIEKILWK